MERSSQVYVAPKIKQELQSRVGEATSTLVEEAFKPSIPNTTITASKKERGANVIFTTDLVSEINEVKNMMEAEGLQTANLIFNGLKIRVSKETPTNKIVSQFIADVGIQHDHYFQLKEGQIKLLDNTVFTACAISKILNSEENRNIPVRFKFETPFIKYDTVTVFRQDTPEDVFEQLKGKLWFNGVKGKLREPKG